MCITDTIDQAYGVDAWRPMGPFQTAIITSMHGAFTTDEPMNLALAFPDCVVYDFASGLTSIVELDYIEHHKHLTDDERRKVTSFSMVMRYMIAAAAYQIDAIASTASIVAGVHLGNHHAELHGMESTIYRAFTQTAMITRRLEGIKGRQAKQAALAVRTERGAGYSVLRRTRPLVIRTPKFPVGMIPKTLRDCLTRHFQWHD